MPALVFIAFMAFGIWCLAPSVTVGDSGEFITAAATLSLPHPPSYPLYGLAGKAAGLLFPLGNWGYRTNLFSLLCSALTLALFWFLGRRCGLSRLSSIFAALVLSAPSVFLYHSFVTEVFTLNLLLGIIGLWILADPALSPVQLAASGGLLLGLGVANHQTILMTVPALLYGLWLRAPLSREFIRGFLFAAFFFVVGFLLYLYLPIRAAKSPPLDWGHPVNWDAVWRVILRKDYGSLALTTGEPFPRSLANESWQLVRYAKAAASALSLPGLALTLLGAWSWKAGRPDRWTLIAFFFFTGPFFLLLGNPPVNAELEGVLPRFYLLSLVPLALWAGRGFDFLIEKSRMALALFLVPAGVLVLGSPSWNVRHDFLAYDYGRSVLKSLPPGSAFFMDGGDDTFYSLSFLRFVENRRTDLELHDRGGLVFKNPYGPDFRRLTREEKDIRRRSVEREVAQARPLYYSTMNPGILPGYDLVPLGLAQRAVPTPAPVLRMEETLWPYYVIRMERGLLERHYRCRALAPFPDFLKGLTSAATGDYEGALLHWAEALSLGPDVLWLPGNVSYMIGWHAYRLSAMGLWREAELLYRRYIRFFPSDPTGWMNLGVAAEKLGLLREAESYELKAVSLDPQNVAAYYSLGALYWKMEDWDKAAGAFRRYLELKPGDSAGMAYLRQVEERQKR